MLKYQPTWESVSEHPLPQWYDDAKFGIFVHWGAYSVPAWAPTGESAMQAMRGSHEPGQSAGDVPDGAFYFNNLEIPGSQTRAYHDTTYGATFNYDQFVPRFNQEVQGWDPNAMAELFAGVGARYVVLTAKHHEGFLMWRSAHPNPFKPQFMAERDIVQELATAVRAHKMRMGVYYSGGLDWTFNPGPIRDFADTALAMPQSEPYVDYITAQFHELIERFEPAVLWNDIGMPVKANVPELFANYYNRVPDGVVDERYGQFDLGVLRGLVRTPPFKSLFDDLTRREFHGGSPPTTVRHSDFTTPEYAEFKTTLPTKWEATRAIGHSFGYNRNEKDADYLSVQALVSFLVDVVSKNGNLLLNVGPQADGTIPGIQRERLKGLGDWLALNGEAIFETRPWLRAEGVCRADGADLPVRFTQKQGTVYATVLGVPEHPQIRLMDVGRGAIKELAVLGAVAPLQWTAEGKDLVMTLPQELPRASIVANALTLRIRPASANSIAT